MTNKYIILIVVLFFFSCKDEPQQEIIDSNLPESPTDLTLELIGKYKVKLNWDDNSTNEKGYKVERKVDGGEYQVIATLNSNTTNFIDSNLNFNTIYYYRIFAYNTLGNSQKYTDEKSIGSYPYLPDNLQSNLILYLPFDGDVKDLSQYGNDGIMENVSFTSNVFNKANSAIKLNGSNSNVIIPNSNSLSNNIGTIYAWVNNEVSIPNNIFGNTTCIIYKGENYFLRLRRSFDQNDNGKYNFRFRAGSFFEITSPESTINNWNKLAVVINDKDTSKIFLNSVYNSLYWNNIMSSNTGKDILIGNKQSIFNDINPFEGKLDNLLLFSRALTNKEIEQLTKHLELMN